MKHHMSVLSAVLVFRLLSVPMDSDVGVQHIILVKMQVDAGIVQCLILILVLIQFQSCRSRPGLDLSGQNEEQLKLARSF